MDIKDCLDTFTISLIFFISGIYSLSFEVSVVPDRDSFVQREHSATGSEQTLLFGTSVANSRILLHFNLDDIKFNVYRHFQVAETTEFTKSFIVEKASLKLTCVNVFFGEQYNRIETIREKNGTFIRIFKSRLLRPWDEEFVTWKYRDHSVKWSKPSIDATGKDAMFAYDFTDIKLGDNCDNVNIDVSREVISWLNDSTVNHGILLWNEGGMDNVTIEFASRESNKSLLPVIHVVFLGK